MLSPRRVQPKIRPVIFIPWLRSTKYVIQTLQHFVAACIVVAILFEILTVLTWKV